MPQFAVDVNGDGMLSPLDALAVITELSRLNSQLANGFQAVAPSEDTGVVADELESALTDMAEDVSEAWHETGTPYQLKRV